MNKIKVGIDIDNIWEEWGNFRLTIKNMSIDVDHFSLYIVTKSSDVGLIQSIATALELDMSTQVFHSISDDIAVDAKLSSLGIEIFLSGDYELVSLVNENNTAYTVIVNSIQDTYYMQPKWFTKLNEWIELIDKANGQAEVC